MEFYFQLRWEILWWQSLEGVTNFQHLSPWNQIYFRFIRISIFFIMGWFALDRMIHFILFPSGNGITHFPWHKTVILLSTQLWSIIWRACKKVFQRSSPSEHRLFSYRIDIDSKECILELLQLLQFGKNMLHGVHREWKVYIANQTQNFFFSLMWSVLEFLKQR